MNVERPGSSSTVLRIILGAQLRRLREASGLSRQEAGDRIRSSESKISRLELGRVSFKERDVADLLALYGVADEAEREAILAKAREANTPGWWHRYHDVLPNWFQTYVGLEASTSLIRTYEIQFVPGLLQTADYARAVIRLGNPDASAAEIEHRVELRLRRQERLSLPDAPRLWVVIDETALRRPLGGPETMRGQLEHLIAMCAQPHTTIQIMPLRFGGHVAEGGAFTVLRFPEPEVPDVVYLENLTGALYLDKPEETESYLRAMERLCVESATPESTPEVLSGLLRTDYRTSAAAFAQHGGTVRTQSSRLPAAAARKSDFHAVLPTSFGTRILIGDVLGIDGSARQTVETALAGFRQLAPNEPTLPGVAERMHSLLAPMLRDGEFVTALLLTLREDTAEIVCCGNPPPLLIREGRALPLEALPCYPPLTLLDIGGQWPETTTVPLRHDDRLLLHPHGPIQTRHEQAPADSLAERAAALCADDPAVSLESVQADLLDHAVDGLHLPPALLLAHLERHAPRPETAQAMTHWTVRPND
ncbi:Stage II sporulation protein E (SpoIIE) [Mycobacterium tuberculosis]|nr:Stage II sporulation protein E (SpoIIE) [Mycobacterium tuberculosis]